MKMADDFVAGSDFLSNVNISGIEAGKREGIIAVWKLLDSYRERLVFQTQKFQHEKYVFECDRAAALKEIHVDLQSKFQSKLDSLVSQRDEALNLLQSKNINSLEDKLNNHPEKTFIADETTGSELMHQNSLLKSAFKSAQLELQSQVEQKQNDKHFYENRISQLEADVIQLEQERDQWARKGHPSDHPEFHVQIEMDKVLPVMLSTKERDGKSATLFVCSGSFDDVNKQLDPSDSSGSEVQDRSSDTSSLDSLNSLDTYDEIVHVIETSSSQFTMALGTYKKILNNLCKLELTYSVWVQIELLETCHTNLECLDAVLSVLKNGYVNAGLTTAIQDLMKKWIQLDAKINILCRESV